MVFLDSWRATTTVSLALVLALLLPFPAVALDKRDQEAGVIECDSGEYGSSLHNPGLVARTGPQDPLICFAPFVSDFDGGRKSRGEATYLRIPRWVAQKVSQAKRLAEGRERPQPWFTVPSLYEKGVAPNDSSYVFSKPFREKHPNWYDRGHLAQKYLAERMGPKGGWVTHNMVNAVPQRSRFNQHPWLQLECLTGAWANRYEEVWIITGPIFLSGHPQSWLAEPGKANRLPVAIPDALFKVVMRKANDGWMWLAFLYPQDDPIYQRKGPWNPADRLVSLQRVADLTGLTFFPSHDSVEGDQNVPPNALWRVSEVDFDPGCKSFKGEIK